MFGISLRSSNLVIESAWVFGDKFLSEKLPQKTKFGMLEVHNVSNVVIYNAWLSNDRCKSESCHKKQTLVCWKFKMFLIW